MMYCTYNNVLEYVMSRFPTLSSIITFLPVETVFRNLVPLLLILGVGIGFIGSFTTVRKHLRV